MSRLFAPIPVTIHPFFWLFASLIGWINSGSLLGTLIWTGIILVSVLFHEFGHAITAQLFGQRSAIQLIALGGVTTYEGPKLTFWKQFLITFNGPLFGFLLFLAASFALQWDLSAWPMLRQIVWQMQIANLFWTIVNLLPVLPLDGGQLLRIVLEASFGMKGYKASLLFGAAFSLLISFYFFIWQNWIAGAFFFLFAYQSFESFRRARYVTSVDRDEEQKHILIEAELALQEGRKEEAKRLFLEVRQKAPGGLLALTAAQYLAFLYMQEGESQKAYELLLPIRSQIASDTLCLLHQLAAIVGNDALVAELSTACYQIAPSQEMALRNARAFARLNQAKPAGGWLQTAWQYGQLDLSSVLQEEIFQKLKENIEFKEFIDPLQ